MAVDTVTRDAMLMMAPRHLLSHLKREMKQYLDIMDISRAILGLIKSYGHIFNQDRMYHYYKS